MWQLSYSAQGIGSRLSIQLRFWSIICCNNQGAASLAASLVYHARPEYIQIDKHFAHNEVLQKELHLLFCVFSWSRMSDFFTKPLSIAQFLKAQGQTQGKGIPFHLREHVKTISYMPCKRPSYYVNFLKLLLCQHLILEASVS